MKILKLFFVLFFGMILACSFADPTPASGKAQNNATFNIVTYNVRMNTSADGVNAWPLRKDKVAGLLRFHRADIFNLQEALPEQLDDLAASFPEFDHVGVGRDDGKRLGEHMLIFYRKSRFQKLDDGMFWLSENPSKPGLGWDAVCNRTVTWIKLKDLVSGKTLLVFDTHFDHRGKIARDESAKLILKSIKEINKENLPVILTGDFNLTKETTPIQLILTELKDSRDQSKETPYGPEGTSGGFDVKVMPRTIDYIFINGKVEVKRQGTLSDSFGLYYPSDHLPVLAEILIN